jgi:ATP-dependent RNA helicase RhlE
MMKLRKGVDILVATPGRLMDLHSQNAIRFDHLQVLVLDEADRMLDMGFIRDIQRIIDLLPIRRQNLLFSATFSDDIRNLARGLLRKPIEISVSPANRAATTVTQTIHPVDKKKKAQLLTRLIRDGNWDQALVFTKTKHGANKLTKHLESEGIVAAAIHGNKSQGARTKALAGFKAGEIRILVATDIAARGLDIEQLPQVVNFDLPNVSEDYVHRIGRTGRAGQTGQAISLVSADEVDLLSDIERLIQQLLQREEIKGYEPKHAVPETTLRAPVKPKKPRKALNRETGAGNRSRQGKKSAADNRSGYGQGPKPGSKRKSGGRNQTVQSKDSGSRDAKRSSTSKRKSASKGKPANRSGQSPWGSGGGKRNSGKPFGGHR